MYESHLRLYLLPHLDRIPLAALTIAELRAMFAGRPKVAVWTAADIRGPRTWPAGLSGKFSPVMRLTRAEGGRTGTC
jgi:hypothetical protein